MDHPAPTRALQLDSEGRLILGRQGHTLSAAHPDGVLELLAAGHLVEGPQTALALAVAFTLSVRDRPGTRAVDLAYARLLLVQPDDLVVWRVLARLREVMDVTPPTDRPARARLEAILIEMELCADEAALSTHVELRLRSAAQQAPGFGLTVMADPALLRPGLLDPGPVDLAVARAGADGIAVDLHAWNGAMPAATRADLALLSAVRSRVDGSLDVTPATRDLAAAAAAVGVPVWAVLPAARIDWDDRHGPAPSGLAVLPAERLAGIVTERGACTIAAGGPAALFPEQQRPDPHRGSEEPGRFVIANEA